MKNRRKEVLLLAAIFCVSCAFLPKAQAQSLEKFTCVPESCTDVDFGNSSFAQVTVLGTCNTGAPFPGSDVELTISVAATNCSIVVETEAKGSGGDQTFLDDCGNPYQLGKISVFGQIFNASTGVSLYSTAAAKDCAGGETTPLPAFKGC